MKKIQGMSDISEIVYLEIIIHIPVLCDVHDWNTRNFPDPSFQISVACCNNVTFVLQSY